MQHQNIAIPYASITDNAPTYEITTDLKTKINCLLNNSRSSVNSSAHLCGECALHHIFEPTSCQEIPSPPRPYRRLSRRLPQPPLPYRHLAKGPTLSPLQNKHLVRGRHARGLPPPPVQYRHRAQRTFSTWCHCYLPQDLIAGPHLI